MFYVFNKLFMYVQNRINALNIEIHIFFIIKSKGKETGKNIRLYNEHI